MTPRNVILIYSGGLDSTVLLAKLLHDGSKVKCLSINYGQRHGTEIGHARDICKKLGVEHFIADLSTLRPLLKGSSQTDDAVAVPHGHYEEESMKATVVPNRNMLMLSIAGAWAISSKFDAIAYAAHGGDRAIYPDCREEFVQPLGEALMHADWHIVEIDRPFLNITKADIVRLGSEIFADGLMADSYSCYEGREKHCGLCGTCQERREAFQLAGVTDLTQYES